MRANTQPTEKPFHDKLGTLQIQEIFYTIQGEGPYAGQPAVFIRTAGCNLQCPLCDSDYTSRRTVYSVSELVAKVTYRFERLQRSFHVKSRPLVVITGGEPFRQNITPLAEALLQAGYRVQVETNGTFYLATFPYSLVTIVCSPKTPTINANLPVDAYKYVMDAQHMDIHDGLPTSVLGQVNADNELLAPARPREWDPASVTIYLQPADEVDAAKNADNRRAVIASCMKYGYTFCLQMQKILNLP
jgi:organic radical activating enzyme